MDNKYIQEGEKLICQFLKHRGYISFIEDGYHRDWDLLMGIVEEIEKIHDEHHGYFAVYISSNSCTVQGTNLHLAIDDLEGYGYVYMSDPNAILETKIESTFYNIVEFIKWYNANLNPATKKEKE